MLALMEMYNDKRSHKEKFMKIVREIMNFIEIMSLL